MMASPSLRSRAGESSSDEGEPIEGAAEGCAQAGVKTKLKERANTSARENVVGVKVDESLAIRL
jgi:hypothetical protein